MRGGQHRLQQRMCCQLGDAVGQPHREPRDLGAGRFAHFIGNALPQLEYLFGPRIRRLARLGQRHPAAGWLEQLVPQGLLQIAHLRTDGLHRHLQAVGGAGKAAFLGNHPEIVKMAVVQHAVSGSEKPNTRFG